MWLNYIVCHANQTSSDRLTGFSRFDVTALVHARDWKDSMHVYLLLDDYVCSRVSIKYEQILPLRRFA